MVVPVSAAAATSGEGGACARCAASAGPSACTASALRALRSTSGTPVSAATRRRPRQEGVLEGAAHELPPGEGGEQHGPGAGYLRFLDVAAQVRRKLGL